MFQPSSFSIHLGYRETGKGPLRCGPIDCFPSPDRFAMVSLIEEIARERRQDRNAVRIRYGLFLALLSQLLLGIVPGSLADRAEGQDPLLARCHELIEVYFARLDFSVIWLAGELKCSPDHLSRRFRAQTGHRLIETVHQRRIDHARQLLRESTMNVGEIAWACGFAQPSHFNRIFRRITGTTPRLFREQREEALLARK